MNQLGVKQMLTMLNDIFALFRGLLLCLLVTRLVLYLKT